MQSSLTVWWNSRNSRLSNPKLIIYIHSADQAAIIVIEGAEVTSKPTEVSGKVRAVSF